MIWMIGLLDGIQSGFGTALYGDCSCIVYKCCGRAVDCTLY